MVPDIRGLICIAESRRAVGVRHGDHGHCDPGYVHRDEEVFCPHGRFSRHGRGHFYSHLDRDRAAVLDRRLMVGSFGSVALNMPR
jgi:hypothetical protein